MPWKIHFGFPKEPSVNGKNYLFSQCEENCNNLMNFFYYKEPFAQWKSSIDAKDLHLITDAN